MTKKHYEAIAQVINDEIRPYSPEAVQSTTYNVINNLADYFADDNPKFNRERFLEACGIEA
jgi:Fe-S-cluster formation regulator IscX/YfhJ